MTKVVVIDYNMGNTDSVVRAIEKCDGNPILSNSKSDFTSASHIILPGVGAFKEGMENIKNLGLESILQEQVLKHKKPFLGICLGMQLLADKGFENGEFRGLGWIEGDVKEFEKTDNDERIPHIGWNEVNFKEKKYLFENVISGKDMYFVHSYHFVSAVRKDNIFGVQFRPEKSQKNGFKILKNFLSIA